MRLTERGMNKLGVEEQTVLGEGKEGVGVGRVDKTQGVGRSGLVEGTE